MPNRTAIVEPYKPYDAPHARCLTSDGSRLASSPSTSIQTVLTARCGLSRRKAMWRTEAGTGVEKFKEGDPSEGPLASPPEWATPRTTRVGIRVC